jgi:hypothetical protein
VRCLDRDYLPNPEKLAPVPSVLPSRKKVFLALSVVLAFSPREFLPFLVIGG